MLQIRSKEHDMHQPLDSNYSITPQKQSWHLVKYQSYQTIFFSAELKQSAESVHLQCLLPFLYLIKKSVN